MELREAIEEYLIEKSPELSVKTDKWYTKRLNDFEAYCSGRGITELGQITTSTVVQFVNQLNSTNSYTRHGYGQVVKSFMNYCLANDEQGEIKEKTVKNIKLVKQEIANIEPLSNQDIQALLGATERLPFPLRGKALITLLCDTGVRASELCYDSSRHGKEVSGLKMSDVCFNREDPYIVVFGKGKKSRSIPLSSHSLLALKQYINRERKRDVSEYVFVSRKNEPLGVRQLEQYITALGEEAELNRRLWCHLFRHFFATTQLAMGTNELLLAKLLGHTSLEATRVYARSMSQSQIRKITPSVLDQAMGKRRG